MTRRLLLAAAALALVPFAVAAAAVSDPLFDQLWGIQKVGADKAWATATGAGITVAIVDTGVHKTHEDLAGKFVAGTDLIDDDDDPQDRHGHGTHVAGIAAAYANNGRGVAGVSPDAKIMPVRVLSEFGFNVKLTPELLADVAAGIRWAVDHGADVVNLSLGSPTGATFREALEYAWSKGVIVVAAAGNDDVPSDYTDEPAIVVGATDRNDQKASYSNEMGEARWGIVAPGGGGGTVGANSELVLSTWYEQLQPSTNDAYAHQRGTSMAAPHVAGAAAVLRSLGLTPLQTVNRLLETAKDLGAPGRDPVFGSGRLDLAAAVDGLTPPERSMGSGPPAGGEGGGGPATGPSAGSGMGAPGGGSGGRAAEANTSSPGAGNNAEDPDDVAIAADGDDAGGSRSAANIVTGAVIAAALAGAWGYRRIRGLRADRSRD